MASRTTLLEQHGTLHIVHAAPPNELGAVGVMDAIKAFALEHAPGRRAHALRIALGGE